MPTDLQSRTQYLVLAEFCQGVISSLCSFVEGSEPLPTERLSKLLNTLEAVQAGKSYRFGQRTAVALGSYEQVRTIEEAWKPNGLSETLKLTAELVDSGAKGKPEQKRTARQLISLFSKLQTRALWNFEQPKQLMPPDLGDLCRALKTA
jgi:hypothetical protein